MSNKYHYSYIVIYSLFSIHLVLVVLAAAENMTIHLLGIQQKKNMFYLV
jgi:hypothetical protein